MGPVRSPSHLRPRESQVYSKGTDTRLETARWLDDDNNYHFALSPALLPSCQIVLGLFLSSFVAIVTVILALLTVVAVVVVVVVLFSFFSN